MAKPWSPTAAGILEHHHLGRASAAVFQDYKEEIVEEGGRHRPRLRTFLLFFVVIVVIAAVAIKYATDNSLRRATSLNRQDDLSKVSQTQIDVSYCPCEQQTIPYSVFVSMPPLKAPVENVCAGIVSGQKGPANDTVRDDLTVQFETNALMQACINLWTHVVDALTPDPANAQGACVKDCFHNPDLLSKNQTELAVQLYVGNWYFTNVEAVFNQLGLSTVVANTEALQAPDFTPEPQLTRVTNDQQYASGVLAAMSQGLIDATGTKEYQTVFTALNDRIKVNYTTYMNQCNPFYCDIITSKTVWARLVEFLSLVGGLWSTICGVAIVLWIVLGRIAKRMDERDLQRMRTMSALSTKQAEAAAAAAAVPPLHDVELALNTKPGLSGDA